MLNPYLMQAARTKQVDGKHGKYYRPTLIYHSRQYAFTHRAFVRAAEAQAYAERILVRWRRLYDAAIVKAATEGQSMSGKGIWRGGVVPDGAPSPAGKDRKTFEPCPGGCGRQVMAGSGECRKCHRRKQHEFLRKSAAPGGKRKYRQKED